MKTLLALAIALAVPTATLAQDDPSGKTLASSLDVFVFPADGQDSSAQSQDEVECYQWAVTNVGSDPFDMSKQQESDEQLSEAQMAAAQQTGQGSGARTAVRGAAAGALIGEVTGGDAGDSAKIGAAAGLVAGRRRGRAANQQAVAQAESSQESRVEATSGEIENFKSAFSVCLEAKDYMVKY